MPVRTATRSNLVLGAAAAVLGAAVLATTSTAAAAAAAVSSSASHFLVMGDWGGQDTPPYTTAAELATARGMASVAATLDTNLSLALGDNFYTFGVKDEFDPRFKQTFEDVFSGTRLQAAAGFRFRVIAGNHDHNGNVSAQIQYSGHSQRWVFPAEYYTFRQGPVAFVMIDTVTLCGSSHGASHDPLVDLKGNELPGPRDPLHAQTQLEWIDSALAAAADSPYLVVAGHYPVYSVCEHGPTVCLIDQLQPLLAKHHVSAYMNGHDHCAEMIAGVTNDGVQYHTIGSAHLNDPSTAHADTVSADQLKFHAGSGLGGFASVSADGDSMVVTHRDGGGKVLYKAPPIAPRTTKTDARLMPNALKLAPRLVVED